MGFKSRKRKSQKERREHPDKSWSDHVKKAFEEVEKKNQEIREQEVAESEQLYIIWDDIVFGDNRLKFSKDRLKRSLRSVAVTGIFEALNSIKLDFFVRLFGKEHYKLYFYKDTLLDYVGDWHKMLETIQVGQKYYEYKTSSRSRVGPELNNVDYLKLYEQSLQKNIFLRYLASKHQEQYRLIPIMEVRGSAREESLLFRITTKNGRVIIIWENVNDSRATHVFSSDAANHEALLKRIQSFICTEMDQKRSLLYLNDQEGKKLRRDLGYLGSLRHGDLLTYKIGLKNLVRRA